MPVEGRAGAVLSAGFQMVAPAAPARLVLSFSITHKGIKMSFYTIYDNTGKIVATTLMDMGDEYELTPQYAGMNLLADKGDAKTQYVLNGVLTNYTAAQLAEMQNIPDGCSWSLPSCTVVDNQTLPDMQAVACSIINNKRDAIISGFNSFAFNSIVYDADPEAQTNITSAANFIATGGTVPANFAWKAQDNSMHPMAAADIQGLYAAMLAAIAQVRFGAYQRSWELKAQIAAATTRVEIQAVTW
jgi:hypothetical protein